MTSSSSFPEPPAILPFGEGALAVEVTSALELATQQRIWALAAALRDMPGIVETGLGMANLLVVYDPERWEPERLGATIDELWPTLRPAPLEGRIWEFPVVYGGARGPDLAVVAAHAGITPAAAAAMHAAVDYVVFAPSVTPGYGYLFGVPPALVMPRKAVPIMLKEPGTISIGGVQATIGMTPGPSGWYALGHTTRFVHPFDPAATPPLTVAVGDRIRFLVEDVLP
ncbi:MAG: allophanate hydrolase subunit 1 [Alphaproteobacteria bacterium]